MATKTRAVLAAAALAATASSAWAQFKESKEGCVFTPKELEATLGFKVAEGRGSEVTFAGGKSLSCTWGGTGRHSVMVSMEKMDKAGAFDAEVSAALAGKAEAVAGDADRAFWQVKQGDLTDVSLTYVRGNTRTQVRVTGVDQKDTAAVAKMRARVLTLRRAP